MSDSDNKERVVEAEKPESDEERQAIEDGTVGEENPGGQPGQVPNDTGDNRARRAQRTRRTKVNQAEPGNAGNPAAEGGSSGDNSSVENIHQKVNAQPTHAALKRPHPDNNPSGAAMKQPPAPSVVNEPADEDVKQENQDSTPVTFPPFTGIGSGDGSEEDFDYECDSSEPSKMGSWLHCFTDRVLAALGKVLCLIKWVFLSIIGAFKSIFSVLQAPVLLGVLSYTACVYVMGTFIVKEYDGPTDFSSMYKYAIRCCIWNLAPVVLALVMVQTSGHAKHNQFLYEGVLDLLLFAANGLLLVTHAEQELKLHWLTAIASVSVVYRFLYWISLFRMSAKWRRAFSAPSTLNITVLFFYNICSALTANFGCSFDFLRGGEAGVNVAPSTESTGHESEATQTDSAPSGEPSWF